MAALEVRWLAFYAMAKTISTLNGVAMAEVIKKLSTIEAAECLAKTLKCLRFLLIGYLMAKTGQLWCVEASNNLLNWKLTFWPDGEPKGTVQVSDGSEMGDSIMNADSVKALDSVVSEIIEWSKHKAMCYG